MITYTNEDCLVGMARYPDKYFELAIVDPPYGINIGEAQQGKWVSSRLPKKQWDKQTPTNEYWNELFRVSTNQIVFGGNYFMLPTTRGFVVWDKGAGFVGRDFAECEYIWTSFDMNAKMYHRDPLASGDYHGKIHPTQKPIALYKWLLANYAKQGDKILDTHVGSASSLIACYDMGFDAVGFELDKEYYEASMQRLQDFMQQPKITDLEIAELCQGEL